MHKEIKLKNGIRLVLVPKKDTKVVTIACGFAVGSRHESEKNQGISHLLEHLIYDGAKKRKTAKEVSEYVDSLGAEHNAFTNKEYTGYYMKLNPKDYEKALDFLSDNIINSRLEQKEIDKEKKVIIEEIDMHEDIPTDKVVDTIDLALYSGHTLAKDIAGPKKILSKITREDLVRYKNRHYAKDNFVLVAAGDIDDENQIKEKVEKYFKELPEKSSAEDGFSEQSENVLTYPKKIEQVNYILAWRGPSETAEDKYSTKLLLKALSGSMSSRLFRRIREELGLVYAIEGFVSSYSDLGSIQIYAGLTDKNLELSLSEIKKELDKVIDAGISQDELEKAKKIIMTKVLINSEDTANLAIDYLTSLLVCNKIETPEKKIAKYRAISLNEVNQTAKKYLRGKTFITLVGPNLEKKTAKKIINKYFKPV